MDRDSEQNFPFLGGGVKTPTFPAAEIVLGASWSESAEKVQKPLWGGGGEIVPDGRKICSLSSIGENPWPWASKANSGRDMTTTKILCGKNCPNMITNPLRGRTVRI